MTARAIALGMAVGMTGVALAGDGAPAAGDRFTMAQGHEFGGLDRRREGRWKGPFFFVILADPQFGFFTRDKGFNKETELTELAVDHINRLGPRFVIVLGDMTSAVPVAPRYEAQVREFKRVFGRVRPEIPIICLCGNHDAYNSPNRFSLGHYRRNFGDDYFGFWAGGVRGLVVNSCLHTGESKVPDEVGKQDEWFARELGAARRARARHILVFQHHPWFLNDPDEPDQYYSLPKERRMSVLELMRSRGVRAVFAGHYHHEARGTYRGMEMITCGPVGQPAWQAPEGGKKTQGKSGLRIVKVYADRVEHSYHALEEVPSAVALGRAAAR